MGRDPLLAALHRRDLLSTPPPINPSSLVRWRKRIGEEGVEWLLTKTIEAGRQSGAVEKQALDAVAVDTTVMEFAGDRGRSAAA